MFNREKKEFGEKIRNNKDLIKILKEFGHKEKRKT